MYKRRYITDNNNAISSAFASLNVTNAVFDCPDSLQPKNETHYIHAASDFMTYKMHEVLKRKIGERAQILLVYKASLHPKYLRLSSSYMKFIG